MLHDGWYHTGDLGVLDDDGYLSIVGRARDVIRTGGETVAPTEVEQVLAEHPAIAEVAVVGMPDAQWGEVVTAVVVGRAGATEPVPDVDAVRAFCAGRLAPFKHPRRVEVVDALPRTAATGQVQRTLIVERLQVLLTPVPEPACSRPRAARSPFHGGRCVDGAGGIAFRWCRTSFRPVPTRWKRRSPNGR